MEALRLRRSKQAAARTAGSSQAQPVDASSDHESARSSADDDDESDEDEPAIDYSTFRTDDYDDDFVEPDDEDDAQVVQLPFEFSKYKTMKRPELFKLAVEWMVQKKINPGFAMDDEVYRVAFDRLDDQVKALGGSKFQSAAWGPRFINALKAFPVLEQQQAGALAIGQDHCDACNRSGHPATWTVNFTGSRYDRVTMEDLSDDEDDDEPETVPAFAVGK